MLLTGIVIFLTPNHTSWKAITTFQLATPKSACRFSTLFNVPFDKSIRYRITTKLPLPDEASQFDLSFETDLLIYSAF